jgi:hypothetical protein
MAKIVSYVTREKYNAALADRDAKKEAGISKNELSEVNSNLNLLKNQRAWQLKHPVHGPILRQLDGDPVTSAPQTSVPAPVDSPNVGQQLAPAVQENINGPVKSRSTATTTRARYDNADLMDKKEAPEKFWVTPGHHDHGDNLKFISNGLEHAVSLFSRHFNPENDPNHPSAKIIDQANKELYAADKHLDNHYYNHKRGGALSASSHLNATALRLSRVANLLSENGMTKTPVLSSNVGEKDKYELRNMSDLVGIANRTTKDYSKYADNNSGVAKTPDSFTSNERIPLIGGPDPARLSTAEKNERSQYTKKLTPAEEASDWNLRAKSAAPTFEATPWSPSPARVVKLHTTGEGISYPVRKVDQFGRELGAGTSRTESVEPKSVNPEKFPMLPKELEATGAVDYTSARKYRKGYGKELARVVSDVRAARNTVVGSKISETPNRLIPDREVAESSRGTVRANIQKAVNYVAEKSLFPTASNILPGRKDAALDAIRLAHTHFNQTHDKIDNGQLPSETDPADVLPTHIKKLLGPHGTDLAVRSYPTSKWNSANMAKPEASSNREEESAPSDVTSATVNNFFEQSPGIRRPSSAIMGAMAKADASEKVMNQVHSHIANGNLALAAKTHYNHFNEGSSVPFTQTAAHKDPEGYLRDAGMSRRLDEAKPTRGQRMSSAFRGE